MIRSFDSDPLGSILQYAVLAQSGDTTRQKAWTAANLRHQNVQFLEPFVGAGGGVTRSHMINMVSAGRDSGSVRQQVSSVFEILERHRLITPYHGDANPATTYREVTYLGRDLLESDSYEEYLYGSAKIVEKWRASVLRLVNPGGAGIGTGFVISKDCVATARHVIEDLPQFVIEAETGARFAHADVLYHPDPHVDLAVVRLKENVTLRPFRLAPDCAVLDPVVVFGFPPIPQSNDAYLVVNRGEVSALPLLYPRSQRAVVVSCLLRGGNSGGPVVNSRGNVVGIVSRQLFRKVAPTEESLNETLGLAAATEAHLLHGINSAA